MAKYTKEAILQMAEEEDVEFIRLQFTDMFGMMKNMAITAGQLEKALNNQCVFEALRSKDLSPSRKQTCFCTRISTPLQYFRGVRSKERLQD